ncbi:hemolysin, partial [Pseudoalteromonas sp. Angola-31]|nr:hemolysin [Pseudoalteromonas sp. Angola-31]
MLDHNGAVLWSVTGDSIVWFSSVADIDNDGQPEVILSIPSSSSTPENSRIVALEANGNVKWEVNTESHPGGGAQAISNFLGANNMGIV